MRNPILRGRNITIDGWNWPIVDAIGDEDPMGVLCRMCGGSRCYAICGELTQHGLYQDCCVLLCDCQKCTHKQAIRFMLDLEVQE